MDVSIAGGPFAPLEGLSGCPLVSSADDGTAAIVGLGAPPLQLVVRRGGVLGSPIALDDTAGQVPGVAVARGGWVAAAWMAYDGQVETLWLLVVAPDGRQTRTVIDRARSENLNEANVGIGPAGDAVVMWSRANRREARLRVARVPAGGAPVVSDLPGDLGDGYSEAPYAVAVAPSGETLITWASLDGVRAQTSAGGGGPVLISSSPDALYVSAAINDAGAAVVVHQTTTANEIVVVERPAGANWSAPRVVGDVAFDDRSSIVAPVNETVLTADGRSVVVWRDEPAGHLRVSAVSGRVGGSWTRRATLSSVTREAFFPTVFLDALGEPRVLWTELGLGLRGARLAPARDDVTPPQVDARLPSRVARTETGGFRVAVHVRCSEACDARLRVSLFGVVRALSAGRTATLRVRVSRATAREFRGRRLRLGLLVTDRAGNVVRSSRVVRVPATAGSTPGAA
jgi:hypothetical protein